MRDGSHLPELVAVPSSHDPDVLAVCTACSARRREMPHIFQYPVNILSRDERASLSEPAEAKLVWAVILTLLDKGRCKVGMYESVNKIMSHRASPNSALLLDEADEGSMIL